MLVDDVRQMTRRQCAALVCTMALVSITLHPTASLNGEVDTIWLGNGCFWERQWSYVQIEKAYGRLAAAQISARAGYAGGRSAGTDGRVCYGQYDASTYYGALGHAEVVQISVTDDKMFNALAADYFRSFIGPMGAKSRPDPMDCCEAYRSTVGLPGGVDSPKFLQFARANVFNMSLRAGSGADPDTLNTVWVLDTRSFPFYPAEPYHQFHSNFFESAGMEYVPSANRLSYPHDYVQWLWRETKASGQNTGCPSGAHW